jgi:hypothetical protein
LEATQLAYQWAETKMAAYIPGKLTLEEKSGHHKLFIAYAGDLK